MAHAFEPGLNCPANDPADRDSRVELGSLQACLHFLREKEMGAFHCAYCGTFIIHRNALRSTLYIPAVNDGAFRSRGVKMAGDADAHPIRA